MNRTVVHLDVDAFAVAVIRNLRPELRSSPIIVANALNARGLVTCASYELRKLGVFTGMPLSRARRRSPHAMVLAESRADCEKCSLRLLEFLRQWAPVVEAASLDDFYLDVSGCEKLFGDSIRNWAVRLANEIYKSLRLPVCIGIGSNKMIARIATTLAKPGHLMEIPAGQEQDFLAPVATELLPGIGNVMRSRLREFGIVTIGQLLQTGQEILETLFGPQGVELFRRASGKFDEGVKPTALHRCIVHLYQFPRDSSNPAALEGAATLLAQKLAFDLRRHGVRSQYASVRLTYSDGLSVTRPIQLAYPSNQDRDFIQPVQLAVSRAFVRRVRVRIIRLRATFIPHSDGQFDLLEERCQTRNQHLYQAIDSIRRDHGFKAVITARTLQLRQQ
jgi:DNA polymerase-4